MTTAEAAEALGEDAAKLRGWLAEGAPHTPTPDGPEWDLDELADWLRARVRRLAAPSVARALGDAKSPADLAEATRLASVTTALGLLPPSRGHAVQRQATELRQALRAEAAAAPPTERPPVLLTAEGLTLVEAFEGILDGRRRARVLDVARAELEADLETFPLATRGDPERMRALLEAEGLDAWGDPVEAEA